MNVHGRRVVFDSHRTNGDPRSTAGAAAAIIVAMINRTDGFDIANADHRASVTDAIGEVMDSLTNAIGRSQPYDQYAE